MTICKRAILALPLLLVLCPTGWADTVSLLLTDDAHINGNDPNLNVGANQDLFVHNYGPKYALVRFDAASIAGQDVTSATLRLFLSDIKTAGTISIHAITSSWNESSVTWNNQPPAEAIATAVISVSTSNEGSTVSVDVTDVVARWADGSLADGGFMIVTADGIKAYFDAKENPAGIAAVLEAETGPGPDTGEAIVLDTCSVTTPGYYVLAGNLNCEPLTIQLGSSERMTLDLRGYSLFHDKDTRTLLVVSIESGNVTLRNGRITALEDTIEASEDTTVRLENIFSGSVTLLGDYSYVTDSRFANGAHNLALSVADNSIVRNSRFYCGGDAGCLWGSGDNIVLRDNIVDGSDFGITMYGSDGIVTGNVANGGNISTWTGTSFTDNVVSNNIVRDADMFIGGTANIVDGNMVINGTLEFDEAGNYYGNNRVAGSFVGTDGQTDWGGNVTF